MPSVDCAGGSAAGFVAAADLAICDVLSPLAALDQACAASTGSGCESAARQLSQAATTALHQIEASAPAGSVQKAAAQDLRSAFQDYATAGSEIAQGIGGGRTSQVTEGMNELSAGSAQLTDAGAALSG